MKRTIRSAISVSALLFPLVAWAQPTDGRKDANESVQESSGQTKVDNRESGPKKLGPVDFPNDVRAALVEFHRERQGRSSRSAVTTSPGLEDIAAETLQILGQVVANRASAEAYRLVKIRLETLLRCGSAPTNAQSASNPQSVPLAQPVAPSSQDKLLNPTFPSTCRVLRPLRIEDIATSRDALLGAIVQDGLAYLQNVQALASINLKQADEMGASTVLNAMVLPLVVRPNLLADDVQARTIVGALENYVDRHWSDPYLERNKALHAVVAGVLAYTRCTSESTGTGSTVADCNFTAYADLYAGNEWDTQAAARALAAQLVSVATLTRSNDQPAALQRVIRAVDALFASSCMLSQASTSPNQAIEFKCPEPPDEVNLPQIPATTWLSFAQPIVDAALERDSNALIVSIARAVNAFAEAKYAQDHQRALLLLGSLIQYSATYAAQNQDNAEQLHQQRTKILESLTSAMSDRTARDGDDIWSFGGSLRMVGGIRVGGAKPALLSPLGLPIGFGFDHVASGSAGGFHLEISPIDLGQYVSFDNKADVRTPKVADAIAPSMTLGVGWGRSMPLVLGATFGYSPAFRLDPNKITRGTFNAGLTLGIYVPLLDMN
jgi:hypothetical protein